MIDHLMAKIPKLHTHTSIYTDLDVDKYIYIYASKYLLRIFFILSRRVQRENISNA